MNVLSTNITKIESIKCMNWSGHVAMLNGTLHACFNVLEGKLRKSAVLHYFKTANDRSDNIWWLNTKNTVAEVKRKMIAHLHAII